MKPLKKNIYVLILTLAVVSGLVFANRLVKDETKTMPELLSHPNEKTALDEKQKWEASPDGKQYKAWEVSLEGQKVHASYANIKKYIKAFTGMEAVVTSVTFQRENAKPSGPKWLIVRINGAEYMMQYSPKDFERLKSLNVNDNIIVKSRSAGYSHNHPYLILSGDYIARNNKVLFKRDFSKNKGC